MSDSLRDQLMKSGLVSEQDVKRERTDKTRKNRQKKGRKKAQRTDDQSEAARFAAQVDAAKRARDRDLNKARDAERKRQADEHAAREMLVGNEIRRGKDCELTYNFTVEGRIKKINVNAEQRDGLAAGRLAIGRTRGQFRLVTRDVAERVQAMAPFLIVYMDDGQPAESDPAYEAFPIPDDLMW